MYQGLSLNQAPPIFIPFLYFATAPLLAIAATLYLLPSGDLALLSRWHPLILTATHLHLLGFVTLSMIGALFQMLPVIAGVAISGIKVLSLTIYGLLLTGILSLALTFQFHYPATTKIGIGILLLAFTLLIAVITYHLFRSKTAYESVSAMKLAIFSLLVTVCIGGLLLLVPYGKPTFFFRPAGTDIHLFWGLAGWVGNLIMAVAFQVVPMFYVTPRYPVYITKLPWLNVTCLSIWSISLMVAPSFKYASVFTHLQLVCQYTIVASLSIFALYTLHLFKARKRKISDQTLKFWKLGLYSLVVAAVLGSVGSLFSSSNYYPRIQLGLGLLLVFGCITSIIQAMFYKILPFLTWFHLQAWLMSDIQSMQSRSIPNMKQLLNDKLIAKQFYLYITSVATLLIALFTHNALIQPAVILLALAFFFLWTNVLRVIIKYARTKRQLS